MYIKMGALEREQRDSERGFTDFIWNVIGGALVSAMIAGVIYVLVGMMAAFLNSNESYWELTYLKRYFIAVLIVYLVMPTVLANVLGFLFGGKSKASGTRRITRQ